MHLFPEFSSGHKETHVKNGCSPFFLHYQLTFTATTTCFARKTAFPFWKDLGFYFYNFFSFLFFSETPLIKEVKSITKGQNEPLLFNQNPFTLRLIFFSIELKNIRKVSIFAVWNSLILFEKLLPKTNAKLNSKYYCFVVYEC